MPDLRNRAHDSQGVLESGADVGRPIDECEDIVAASRRGDVWPSIGDELRAPISKLAEFQPRMVRYKESVALMKDPRVTCPEPFGPCAHDCQIIASSLHLNVSSPCVHRVPRAWVILRRIAATLGNTSLALLDYVWESSTRLRPLTRRRSEAITPEPSGSSR